MAQNQVYLIKSGQNSFVEETQAIVGISGGKVGIGTTHPEADLHVTGSVKVGGDLTVDGTLTTINSSTVNVDDINIELGSTDSPTDTTANGGGITLRGTTNKTFNWVVGDTAWTSSENLHIASNKHFAGDELRALGAGGLSLFDNNASGITIKGGKVGVHDSSPVYDLDVAGSGNFASLYVGGNSVLTGEGSIFGKWEDGATAGEIFYTGGNVGVGTTNPEHNLHVVGDGVVDGNFVVNGASGTFNVGEFDVSGSNITLNSAGGGLDSSRGGLIVNGDNGTGKLEYLDSTQTWQSNQDVQIVTNKHLRTDKVRAIDAGGLHLEDDDGNGIHIKAGGDVSIQQHADIVGNLGVTGNLTVKGNFTVNGTTTTVNTQTVEIEDHNLVIAANTGHDQLTAEYPGAGGAYAGILWGTGDAGVASPVSLTYQSNRGFAFEGGNVGIGTANPGYSLDVPGTGNFGTLYQNESLVVTEANLGTAPNQIPLNKDLGSLAYQDAVNLDDVSADMLELRAIAAEISDSAVDVFVYDTSRDSDGGAWRKRTQHTSWYNEELNTATRGGRREFPAVAVIVAEADKVTIYDGDDPDMGMWMVFNVDVSQGFNILASGSDLVLSVEFLNGIICVGMDSGGLVSCNFITESTRYYRLSDSSFTGGYYNGVIADRNLHKGYQGNYNETALVGDNANDVAMTILPNAPIDQNTGLPVPTIAVATNGGVSVIKDDGTVVDITVNNALYTYSHTVEFLDDNSLGLSIGTASQTSQESYYIFHTIPTSDNVITVDTITGTTQDVSEFYAVQTNNPVVQLDINGSDQDRTLTAVSKNAYGTNYGVSVVDRNKTAANKGMIAYMSADYNTGWMPGDIKLATLSDTTVETIGESSDNLLTGDNSTFDSSVGDWISHLGAVLSVDTNKLKITPSNTNNYSGAKLQLNNLNIGTRYEFKVEYTAGDNIEQIYIDVHEGSGVTGFNNQTSISQNGYSSYYFTATQSTMHLYIRYSDKGDTNIFYIDNISVRATTELITNGDFSNGKTGWVEEDADLTNADHPDSGSNSLLVTPTALPAPGKAIQDLTTVSGQGYVLSASIAFGVGCTKISIVDNSGGIINEDYFPGDGNRTITIYFNGDVGMSELRLFAYGGPAYFDNISVRPAEEDRSVNNNGLQIVGEINKTQVAPGADLVAYSGFSANDYLVQPYNEDLNFGTGDFCVMGWAKTTSSENQKIFTRDLDLTNRFQVYINNGGVSVFTEEDDQSSYLEGSTDVNNGSWFNFYCIRRSGMLEVYVNEKKENAQASSDSAPRNVNFGEIPGYVGKHIHDTSNSFEGSIALLRISKTAPTAKQIAKIYRDEKALFQDGAQATLYGTSDAVTALAYDDSNQLLHVGTASGRSDFRGLVRVNNTTTAISNSISAAEGTIIQN